MFKTPSNTMWHTGYAVKKFLSEGYFTVNKMAEILEVTRQNLYGMYGNEVWEKKYIDRLKKAGVKIAGVTEGRGTSNIDNDTLGSETISALTQSYIKLLEEKVRARDEKIEQMQVNLNLQKQIIELYESGVKPQRGGR